MKRIILILATLLAGSIASFSQDYEPKADDRAVVTIGNARFTVLTSRLIRMEWAEDGVFEDRATLGVVNRLLPVPEFKANKSSKRLVIRTSDLTLTYKNTGKFSPDNLTVEFKMNGKKRSWKYGMSEEDNLLGTCRTLDQCDGEKTMDPFDKGVVSRAGWAILDETGRHVFVPTGTDWGDWAQARDGGKDREDLYIFAYGHDYKAAVSDFTKIAGKIPLPPKYAFGYWWCRYWQYSDYEIRDLMDHFRGFNIPIDVFIIDMDWHEMWNDDVFTGYQDQSGQTLGCTGYTWKEDFFPKPENLLQDLHNYGVKTSLNIHPASGIQPYEEPYERMREDYLSRTSVYDGPRDFINEDGSKAFIPWCIDQREWADAYFNSVMHPMEKMGVDFWWLDWQQQRLNKEFIPGMNQTFWINHVFFKDMEKQGKQRPMIYHRWGGVGSHRYQVGFSGDTFATWKVLGYLPYFTSTAANIGYGYWGHDIGGHMQPRGVGATNPELYTRWMQSGVFTPIYKSHSTKNMTMEKRFWVFPEHFDMMREAIRLRYNLSPYIYTAARECYDTGISLCRPMYYEYPEAEEAYSFKQEFMFGRDILATTVCEPIDSSTALAGRQMWLPAGGDWYDVSTGTTYKGGQIVDLKYTLFENPWFVKARAVIPMAMPDIQSLQEASDGFCLFVAPGDGVFSTSLYEDDGATQNYKAEYAITTIDKRSDASGLTLYIHPRKGNYKGALPTRTVRVVLDAVLPAQSVWVNGSEIPYTRFPEQRGQSAVWTYDGASLQTVIYLETASAAEDISVLVIYPESNKTDREVVNGKKGLLRRITSLSEECKFIYATYVNGWKQMPMGFIRAAGTGSHITEDPSNAAGYLKSLDLEAAYEPFNTDKVPAQFKTKLAAWLGINR